VKQRRAGQVQEQHAGGVVLMKTLGAGAKARELQLGMQALAAGLGKQGIGKVQGRVGGPADQAFMTVDATVGKIDHRLEPRAQQPLAQDAGKAHVR